MIIKLFFYVVDSDGRAACKVEAGCSGSGSSSVCTCMLGVEVVDRLSTLFCVYQIKFGLLRSELDRLSI